MNSPFSSLMNISHIVISEHSIIREAFFSVLLF